MHPALSGVFHRRIHIPLPPWTEVFSLVQEFFDEENVAMPLFHPPTFMALLGRQYSHDLDDDPAWWTALNAVLAIAQRRRAERGTSASSNTDLAWRYASNALETVLDIMMRNTRLLSVQALLSLAWFFVGTPNPQPSFILTASAVRLSHSIGIHRDDCHPSQNPIEAEQKKRVFWAAVIMDHYICFRTGRPPAQNWADFKLDLPLEVAEDRLGIVATADGSGLAVFRANAHLSNLEANVYSQLYTNAALENQDEPASAIIMNLDKQLEQWRENFPAFQAHRLPPRGEHLSVLRLYFTYHNCVISIHRMNGRRYWLPHDEPTPRPPSDILCSMERCVEAARMLLKLLDLVPCTLTSFYW